MLQESLSEIKNHFFELLYTDAGAQKIVDYAYHLLGGNSIGVSDTSYRNIVTSTEFKSNDPIILKHKQKGFLSGDALAALKNDRVTNRLQQSARPFYASPSAENKYDIAYLEGKWLFAPIRIHNVLAAFITIPEENGPFPENALQIAEILAQALSLELQKSNFYHENKHLFFEALLLDIIENRTQTEETLRQRVSDVGKRLSGKLNVLIVRHDPKKEEETEPVLDIVSQSSLRTFFPDSLSMVYQREIVLLIAHNTPWSDKEAVNEEFRDFLSGNSLKVSISNPFSKLTEAPEYYMQAKETMHLGERMFPDEHIYRYELLSVHHILEVFRKNGDLHSLCIPALYDMFSSGKESDLILLKTLFTYVRCMKNVSAATDSLFIHKNTLFYRMKKITEAAELDLNNGSDIFRIMLTDLILSYYEESGKQLRFP